MKLFCLLFAFYTIGIAIAPCNDIQAHANTAVNSHEGTQSHHEEESDMCSPFCHCACCSTLVIVTHQPTFNFQDASILISIFTVSTQKLLDQSYSIWQPPKIS